MSYAKKNLVVFTFVVPEAQRPPQLKKFSESATGHYAGSRNLDGSSNLFRLRRPEPDLRQWTVKSLGTMPSSPSRGHRPKTQNGDDADQRVGRRLWRK
jgi:hypothetical protein